MDGDALDAALLEAHAKGNGTELAGLYAQAAAAHADEPERAAFYLTHAYVFALEQGLAEAEDYRAQLCVWSKEE